MLGDLSDLKASIEAKGVLEPILVRPREGGRFTIISGERRFRAAMEAGLSDIPCIVLDVSDAEVLEIALIENLQRKDLSPLEEADGYLMLQERHGYTHEQIAKAVGKSRVTITETISLARLPLRVKDECRRADIRSKSFLLEVGRLPNEPAMLDAIVAFGSGEGVGRDAVRTARREAEPAETGRFRSFRKAYELNFQPPDAEYAVSLVFRGTGADRAEILETLRGLLQEDRHGELSLEEHGRFLKPRRRRRHGTTPPLQAELNRARSAGAPRLGRRHLRRAEGKPASSERRGPQSSTRQPAEEIQGSWLQYLT